MQSVRSVRRVDSARWLLVLVAIACLSQAALAATKVITNADKGGVVHIKFVDRLELRLKSNPSNEDERDFIFVYHHLTAGYFSSRAYDTQCAMRIAFLFVLIFRDVPTEYAMKAICFKV